MRRTKQVTVFLSATAALVGCGAEIARNRGKTGPIVASATPVSSASPPVALNPCDDPDAQLPCYCDKRHIAYSSNTNLLSPCYPTAVQTQTFLLFGYFSAWAWSALNWPITAAGHPDYSRRLGDAHDNATVWETWKTTSEVFLADGRRPPAWRSQARNLPSACRAINVSDAQRKIKGWQDVPADLPPRFLSTYVLADRNAVVDRNHEPIRVDVAMNEAAFDYIYDHELYSKDGQDKFLAAGGTIQFPSPKYKVPTEQYERGPHWIKAAWKVLGPGDDFTQFHKAWAYVSPIFSEGTLLDECQLRVVGLVGLHITSKFELAEKWAWSSFEQANVAPDRASAATAANQFSFFEPHCAAPSCAAENAAPELYPAGSTQPQRSQLVRERAYGFGEPNNNPVPSGTRAINQQLWPELKGSVWENYRLKGTQWFDDGAAQIQPGPMGNTIIEAYDQKESSCIECHGHAGLTSATAGGAAVPTDRLSDRVFALRRAHPVELVQ